MKKTTFTLVLLASIIAWGCKKKGTEPPTAPTGDTETPRAEPVAANTSEDDPDDDPTKGNVHLSDEIKRACGISDSDAYFAFDSANIRQQDHLVLGKLAECFSTGPLKGREMRLVGHADPRGSDEYNMVLGGKRADNVKGFIATKGLADSQMTTTSRGEMDSSGTDEAGWSRDRRVDIMLGN